jgi:hypothetical protein
MALFFCGIVMAHYASYNISPGELAAAISWLAARIIRLRVCRLVRQWCARRTCVSRCLYWRFARHSCPATGALSADRVVRSSCLQRRGRRRTTPLRASRSSARRSWCIEFSVQPARAVIRFFQLRAASACVRAGGRVQPLLASPTLNSVMLVLNTELLQPLLNSSALAACPVCPLPVLVPGHHVRHQLPQRLPSALELPAHHDHAGQ